MLLVFAGVAFVTVYTSHPAHSITVQGFRPYFERGLELPGDDGRAPMTIAPEDEQIAAATAN